MSHRHQSAIQNHLTDEILYKSFYKYLIKQIKLVLIRKDDIIYHTIYHSQVEAAEEALEKAENELIEELEKVVPERDILSIINEVTFPCIKYPGN